MRPFRKRMTPAEYAAYLQSAAWWAIRREAIDRAGRQCEFELTTRDHKGREYTVRCTNTADLHAHHLTYDRLGNELLEDLEILCPVHHGVRHLMEIECRQWREPVFDTEFDAEIFAEGALGSDTSLEHLKDYAPSLCPYCDHVLNKND